MKLDYQNASLSELIQARDIAYTEGSALYDVLAALVVATEALETTQDDLAEAQNEVKSNSRTYSDYDDFREFFHDCFARLDGHYPCPSVTNDYDKSVIFDAIAGIE